MTWQDEIRSILDGADGHWGVAIRSLHTDETFAYNADDVFVAASVFKIPILVEFFRQIEGDSLLETERIELTDFAKNPGTGVLKEMQAGVKPTLYDLAVLMIIVSDNTATDLVLDVLGLDNVNQTMRSQGLENTRVDLTCRDILLDIVGITSPDPTMEEVSEAHRRLRRGDADPNARTISDFTGNNVSTPAEMTELLWRLAAGHILSSRSRSRALDVMQRQQVRDRLPVLLPPSTRVAHKTGELPGIKNDAGVIRSASKDEGFAITVFNRELSDEIESKVLIGRMAAVAAEHFLQ